MPGGEGVCQAARLLRPSQHGGELQYSTLRPYYDVAPQMPVEALVDFTGGFPESYVGPDYGALQGVATDLFKEMQRALEERPGVLITTCSLIQKYRCQKNSGYGLTMSHLDHQPDLLQEHGYCRGPRLHSDGAGWRGGLQAAPPCQDQEPLGKLLRVAGEPDPQNCTILLHASSQGPWSDSDIRRNKQLTYKEKKVLRTGVGEWWMPYDDFTKCFTHLTICHPEPEATKRGSRVTWEETSFKVLTPSLSSKQ